MANEKTWSTVAPQLLTADGGMVGQIQVADTAGFRVKANAVLTAPGKPDLTVQIKRVVSETNMFVGLPNTPIQNHALDISLYTVVAGSKIYQPEQDKTRLRPDDMQQATYENDPVVAWRTIQVDQYGNPYSDSNPYPMAFDGTISVGNVEVVGPNGDPIKPNPDGSINVNIVETPAVGNTVKSKYNGAYSVPSGTLTSLVTYTVPPSTTATLQKICGSGSNYGDYTVSLNGVVIDVQRTWYGSSANVEFNFETGNTNGLVLVTGDTLLVQIIHRRPYVGDFDGRIQVLEIAL